MDLSDALEEASTGSNNQSAGMWPTNPSNPAWPGQPHPNPTWPGGQPSSNPTWPGGQLPPNPTWPGGQPPPNSFWPGAQSGGQGTWPGGNPSQPGPGGWPSPSGPGSTLPTIAQKILPVPFDQNLPNGVFDKLVITICGTINPHAEKIAVNLYTANDIAFHFNPRFNEDGKAVIVRNSCIGTKWGREEREQKVFPFVKGQPFEMKILCLNTEFKVAVNRSHLLEFKHRITNLQSINRFSVFGDLSLSNVQVETLQLP